MYLHVFIEHVQIYTLFSEHSVYAALNNILDTILNMKLKPTPEYYGHFHVIIIL